MTGGTDMRMNDAEMQRGEAAEREGSDFGMC
jgi:hypothetical protein